MLELDFGDRPEILKEEYLDVYEGIQSEILSTTRFDENSDLSTASLGRVHTAKTSKNQSGRIILDIRTRVYNGKKIIRLNRMSNIIRHWS